jgi:hypothetical protein
MAGSFFSVSEYKLTDLLTSSGATIGVIIAGTIFLQFMSTKYTDLCSRYRELTGEYRGRREGEPRHGPLQSQIRMYRRRLMLMNRASCLAAVALLCFLVAVLAGGMSILQPPQRAYKFIGTASLFSGLILIAAAVALGIVETVLSRHELGDEIADLDDHVRDNC